MSTETKLEQDPNLKGLDNRGIEIKVLGFKESSFRVISKRGIKYEKNRGYNDQGSSIRVFGFI